jgi:hypothetical protein
MGRAVQRSQAGVKTGGCASTKTTDTVEDYEKATQTQRAE